MVSDRQVLSRVWPGRAGQGDAASSAAKQEAWVPEPDEWLEEVEVRRAP